MAFGSGAGLYFALLREPRAWVAWVLLVVAMALILAARPTATT